MDYKTSKAIYDESETKTSLQMFTYALAILHEFGSLPTEYLYDFIAINKTQSANILRSIIDELSKMQNELVKTIDKITN